MASKPQRWEFARHALGVLACLLVGWLGVSQGVRIPVLADATYGFHALGHLMTWFLPDAYRAMMGSFFQVLIPLGLAGYFLLFHRDLLGVALMLAWAGVSAAETSRYVADSIARTIVIGPWHTTHDWAVALTELSRLGAADELSWIIQGAALTFILVGMGVAAVGAVRATFEQSAVAHADSFLERRPVFGPIEYEEWTREQAAAERPPAPPSGVS